LSAVLGVALIAYCSYLLGVAAALRQNNLRWSEFAELPFRRRRELMMNMRKS
jgi:hypothetical protein